MSCCFLFLSVNGWVSSPVRGEWQRSLYKLFPLLRFLLFVYLNAFSLLETCSLQLHVLEFLVNGEVLLIAETCPSAHWAPLTTNPLTNVFQPLKCWLFSIILVREAGGTCWFL